MIHFPATRHFFHRALPFEHFSCAQDTLHESFMPRVVLFFFEQRFCRGHHFLSASQGLFLSFLYRCLPLWELRFVICPRRRLCLNRDHLVVGQYARLEETVLMLGVVSLAASPIAFEITGRLFR